LLVRLFSRQSAPLQLQQRSRQGTLIEYIATLVLLNLIDHHGSAGLEVFPRSILWILVSDTRRHTALWPILLSSTACPPPFIRVACVAAELNSKPLSPYFPVAIGYHSALSFLLDLHFLLPIPAVSGLGSGILLFFPIARREKTSIHMFWEVPCQSFNEGARR